MPSCSTLSLKVLEFCGELQRLFIKVFMHAGLSVASTCAT